MVDRVCPKERRAQVWTNEHAGIRERVPIWGDSLGAMSRIKLSQGAFREIPPVSLVPPVSLLVGFPE